MLAKQALGNEHRLQKIRAGYRLRLATDKELAAGAKSGQRLRRGHATNLESDSLLTAISKNGGLSMAERADTIGEGNQNAGGKMVFTRSGRAIDEMARLLDEEGFIPPGEIDSDGGVSWLQNAISDELGGFRKHHSHAGEEWMRRARDEASGDAPDYEAAGVTDELLERVGYFASDPDVQAAVDAIVAAGADVMAHQDTEAVERFWNSLAEVEQQEERNAIQTENHTANAQDATRRRYAQDPDAGEAQAGHRDRSRASFQEEADPAALTRTGAEQGAGSSSRRELQRQPVDAQGEESQRPDLTLTAPTKAQVLAQEAIRERERADKEAPADKPRSKFTGDQVDAFNTQGSVFDATADAVIDTLRFSKNGAAPDEAAALKALSENDDLFMLPKSDKTSVEGIAADNDPDIKVLPAAFPGRRDYLLQLPSGKTARLMVRDASPYGPRVSGFNYEDGDALDMATERPGNNPEDVPADTGDVWLDVSLLESGEEGMLVYNIASTLAHNTGRIFIGDPAGLSNEAMRRRPEQMLSSALKFGTTAHLAPHPRQVSGDAALGVPALKWVYGDHLGNIRRMIDVNLAALENAGADSISFDPTDGQFKDSDDQPISRADITALGSAGLGRAGLAGGTTLARGAVLRALLREAGDGPQGSDGRRNGLLAGVVRESAVHAQALKRLFYSRSADERLDGRPLAQTEDLTPVTTRDSRGTRGAPALASRSELADALKTAFPTLGKAFDTMLARGERCQKGGLVALDSADRRDMAQALASKTPRTVEQALTLLGDGTMQTFESQDGDTQGFYDAKSGLTFVVLPNVSAATAPGVVLHELTHSQQRADIDAKAMALVDDRGSPYRPEATRDLLGRVAQRMADADEADNSQEATAYLVEQAVMEGRQQGFSAVDGGFMAWVDAKLGKAVGGVIRDLVAMVRDWALRRGLGITPTVDDLVAFARSSARAAARGDVVTSTAGDASSSSRADQTLTPAFRRWFGDSKIVDRSGQPRVMYRGDSRDIGPVLLPASGSRGLGLIFFSPSPSFAESYAKGGDSGNMTPAFIKAENPFDSSNKSHRDAVFQRLGDTTFDLAPGIRTP